MQRGGLSDEAVDYLARVRRRGWLDHIRGAFERADAMRIVFVGETIIDEYRYVGPLAKPSKEFILATVETRPPEQFLGGVQAAALHGDWRHVTVVTDDGEPIRKTRYVDDAFTRKLFEVYSKPRLDVDSERRSLFRLRLGTALLDADMVVAFDFGHGLFSDSERQQLQGAKFFAVNAQTNAGNHGFNLVTKYANADLVCVDMPEAQLATGMQTERDPLRLASSIDTIMDPQHVLVTLGRNGAATIDTVVPSFSNGVTDTIGAGDAFLAIAAPLVAAGLDLEIAAFCGNIAGAIKADIIGHRRHVERGELMDRIEELLS